MSSIDKTVGSFRSAIQDLLVPELKAIRTELGHHSEQFQKIDQRFLSFQQELKDLREEMKQLCQEMNRRFEAVQIEIKNTQQEMNRRFEAVQIEIKNNQQDMNKRFEAVIQSIHNLEKTQERILERLDVKERVADLETRFSKFEYFIQQWKSSVMEKKPQTNLEAVES